ncbi:ABC transporter substrate-binding protein [Cocleimonas sp. KMM 6892]|uniref:ABC transporter substrate-binding protein n=1 Tax=unclassified Cocleimonas TaxID=2639732 RepID=UPI002DB5C1EF|nr:MULTISPECIES: ABC transporter substrate-binding protein [unclassified Cocleimonas]MEB8432677.1 ABC transporter substrate-binding protein [Cocleimonas sp. KMM 6892]MEC4715536.1 ABC transporter substrate-binding protein [Cocleimonas sp. KMM 6895]MEC4744846.1 ABC transporter substrate-binding protein [Cocleimonas sp. KMM 6896]
MFQDRLLKKGLLASVMASAFVVSAFSSSAVAEDKKEVKLGVVTFLSGGAAGPFGIPARNAAELLIDAINKGQLPGTYSSVGLAGAQIAPIFVDENSKQKVADYKKLVQKDEVDAVIGYISSGSCKAIAPVAEEEKKLTVFFDCGTSQVFEDIITSPKYVFRTSAHATMDNVAAARYVVDTVKDVSTYSGINQNYAFGQDSWRDFSGSMKVLKESAKSVSEQFPKVFAGQYGAEISALLTKKPDIVHSSFWGGDMEALVIQGGGRQLFSRSKVVLTGGETGIERLGSQIPDGTIIGARGPNGPLAEDSALNDWFVKAYVDRFKSLPTYPSYHMAQAILGVKSAADKANSTDQAATIEAFKGLEFEVPSGKISMNLAGGHQATQGTAFGTYKFDKASGKGTLVNIKRYNAACVNPPEGMKSLEWIESGFKGAVCK